MKLPIKYPGRTAPDLLNFDNSSPFNFKTILPNSRDHVVDGKILTEREYCRRHRYIKNRKTKPALCEICNKKSPRQLANKDHRYDITKLDMWWFICDSCHVNWDYQKGHRISMKTLPDILKKINQE